MWLAVCTGAAAILMAVLGLGIASAQTQSASASAGTIVCPTVADKLPAVPAQAQDEVQRNLALLNTQVREANTRLQNSVGQGGPNFVNNAILGPLRDKRAATIDRITIAIGRHAARPTGLDGLATCKLVAGTGTGSAEPTVVTTAPTNVGNGGNGGTASAGRIVCPSVADKLPAVPAQAQDEVQRNLALLDTQVREANTRLQNSVGQGGPNFVNNAILGPLSDKRAATIDRITIAIGRHAARPIGLDGLATCKLAAG
ncbi:hypothetical protein [Dactylosporangium sp. CA-233914]|uniref:hypothetical protein n=1 Tax=Dactylosporangium sp. CA-233914 TaxID=3239934 RepID=UPI003D8DDAC1